MIRAHGFHGGEVFLVEDKEWQFGVEKQSIILIEYGSYGQ